MSRFKAVAVVTGAGSGIGRHVALALLIGNAATEMTERMRQGVPQADGSVAAEPTMDAGHVARTVVHMASLPLDANVQFVTVMATAMPLVGRG